MSKRISRSTFIKGATALGVASVGAKIAYDNSHLLERIPCRILGPSRRLGHMLRDGKVPPADTAALTIRKRVTIIGGGMAGLSAAWWMQKQGFTDFVLLELEPEPGGNSASGKNGISAFPWGAHYVPIANEESTYVRTLFEELGVIESYDAKGLPVYNELYLCHDPQERLYKDGSFQEGLVPRKGLQPADLDEMARFFKIVHEFRKARGKDGKAPFAIPLDLSSQDDDFRNLDRQSMADWLAENKFKSKQLLWYINYCCRDDYGSTPERVSAWAGLHYFAGRTGKAANSENYSVLTWPEGNGFLVHKLADLNKDRILSGAMVLKVSASEGSIKTRYMQTADTKQIVCESDYVIFAAPRFLSKYLIADYQKHDQCLRDDLVYAPWLVANVSLKKLPESRRGEAIAWDNVSYYSESLGYVVATHQDISTREAGSVITYYYPLSADKPEISRQQLQNGDPAKWRRLIVDDLEKMHPEITANILSIDLWPWGHGMIRPSVGFIWGENRQRMLKNDGRIFFAHSDMSGMSNFEEAQYHGVEAAKAVLGRIAEA